MKKQIRIEVMKPRPVITMDRIREMDHEDVLNLTRRPFIVRNMEYSLPPYFFARTKSKALVFTAPYKTLLEKLEVIGESRKVFRDIPVSFDSEGMPRLNGEHPPKPADKTPSAQLLLRLAK